MLNENSTMKEIEVRFRNARKVMDTLCVAYYGMTWDQYIKYLGRKENGHDSNTIDKADN